MERVDGEGAQLDRNAVQRDGAVFGPSSDRSSVLLGPGGPGKPDPFGPQPHSEPGLAQDGQGGAMR
jgi:hypothetical protein